ncbi:MAG: DUF4013 domain-containing protein [Methanoregula sp.]|jgi:uncharacterized membrane protein YidH (DUF202 family)
MDYGAIVSDSVRYSKAALFGKPLTWLVFILCSLPFVLINFLYDPKTLVSATGQFRWEMIPWTQIALLGLLGLLLSFIVSGYIVRIFRGITPPPSFDSFGALYIDGIKLFIVGLVWMIPALVILVAAFIMMVFGAMTGAGSVGTLISAGFILLMIGLIVLVITVIYAYLGCVRFARTGSMSEAFRVSTLTGTIQAIGWGAYILALVIIAVLLLLFGLIIALLALIPLVGWLIQVILQPLLQVFGARYISRVYDHGFPQEQSPAPAAVVEG